MESGRKVDLYYGPAKATVEQLGLHGDHVRGCLNRSWCEFLEPDFPAEGQGSVAPVRVSNDYSVFTWLKPVKIEVTEKRDNNMMKRVLLLAWQYLSNLFNF